MGNTNRPRQLVNTEAESTEDREERMPQKSRRPLVMDSLVDLTQMKKTVRPGKQQKVYRLKHKGNKAGMLVTSGLPQNTQRT